MTATETTAALKDDPVFQRKIAEMKKYWRTVRQLNFEVSSLVDRRDTLAAQIAFNGLTLELRAAFAENQKELDLLCHIRTQVERLQRGLLSDAYRDFGMMPTTEALRGLEQKWEHAIQHGLSE